MATRMQQRKGTAEQWISTNSGNGPVLNAGEIGYEIDTNKFKIGDGVSHWVDLNYFLDEVALGGNIDDYIPLTQKGVANGVATLNADGVIPSEQIPSLVGLDTEITTAVNNAVNDLVDGAPTALNTLNELAAALGDDVNYAATVTASLATKQDKVTGISDTEIGYLEGVTSNIQTQLSSKAPTANATFTGNIGLPSTTVIGNVSSAEIEHLNGVTSSIQDQFSAATTALSNHESDTTNIHGISDTTKLVLVDGTQTLTEKILTSPGINENIPLSATSTELNILDGATLSTAELNILDGATLSTTELNYVDGVTSSIQTQLDSKFASADASTTNISEGTRLYFTDERAQDAVGNSVGTGLSYVDATGAISVDTSVIQARVEDVSDTEIGYLNGVTSAIQTQIDSKAPLADPTFTGTATTNNLVVDGDFTVNGTNFAASATTITIEDNLVQLAHTNPSNSVDLGLVVAYNDGATKHAGIARDVSENKWKLFKGVTSEPTTTVNFGQGSLDDLALNAIEAVDATFTGTVTGVTKSHVGLGNVDNTSDADKPVSTATQTALDAKANALVSIDPETASYTLILSNREQMVEMDVSSANTLTVPANADVAFPIGTRVHVVQTGTGQTTITPGSGVTVNGTPGLKTRAQWSAVTLVKRGTDTWVAFGDLTA